MKMILSWSRRSESFSPDSSSSLSHFQYGILIWSVQFSVIYNFKYLHYLVLSSSLDDNWQQQSLQWARILSGNLPEEVPDRPHIFRAIGVIIWKPCHKITNQFPFVNFAHHLNSCRPIVRTSNRQSLSLQSWYSLHTFDQVTKLASVWEETTTARKQN